MGEFARHHRLRNDANDLTPTRQHRIGDDTHEPDMPTAIHQAVAVPGQNRPMSVAAC